MDCELEAPLKLASYVTVKVDPSELRPEIQNCWVSWIVRSMI